MTRAVSPPTTIAGHHVSKWQHLGIPLGLKDYMALERIDGPDTLLGL